MAFLKNYQFYFWLILIGLVWIHLFEFLIQMRAQNIIYPDSGTYQGAAYELYIFHRGHQYRPILMSLITGIPYIFGGSDVNVFAFSYYVNLCCWLGFLLVLFGIIKEFAKPKVAFLIAATSIFFVGYAAFIFHLLTKNIFMLLIASGFYLVIKYSKTGQFCYLSGGLGFFVLSMLVRPGAMFMVIFFILLFVGTLLKNYRSKWALLLYASLFLVLLQVAGLKYQFGNFKISYIDSVTYYQYLGKKAAAMNEAFADQDRPNLFVMEPKEVQRIAMEDLTIQVKNNAWNLAEGWFLNVTENGSSGNICIADCQNLANTHYFSFWKWFLYSISKWQNIIFSMLGAILGLLFMTKYKSQKLFAMIGFFIVYTMVTSGISYGQGDCFHVITFPFTLLLLFKLVKGKMNILD